LIRYNTAVAELRALILDYGNVLTLPQAPDVIETMAARLGVAAGAFNSAYWEHRRAYDLGDYSAADYWRRVLGSLGRGPEESVEPALLDWLIVRDGDSWMRYRDEVWDLVREVRGRHLRTAMLSNMPVALAACIRRDRALEGWFDAVIISAELRCAKPDPRIYRLCLARLDADAPQALFVDDRPENVAAAAELGMRTALFTAEDPVTVLRTALGQLP
jgi:putative hydrolase of the HAD superfamily